MVFLQKLLAHFYWRKTYGNNHNKMLLNIEKRHCLPQYRCESGIVILAWRVIKNYVYMPPVIPESFFFFLQFLLLYWPSNNLSDLLKYKWRDSSPGRGSRNFLYTARTRKLGTTFRLKLYLLNSSTNMVHCKCAVLTDPFHLISDLISS